MVFEMDGYEKTESSRVSFRISERRITAPDVRTEREIIPEKVQVPVIPVPAAKPAPAPVPEVEAVYSRSAEAVLSPPEAAVSEAASLPDIHTPPVFLDKPDPVYPPAAVKKGLAGTVVLLLNIDEEGRLAGSEIISSSGYKLLDNAAVKAVGKWSFSPGKIGEKAVSGSVTAEIRFELK